MLVNKFFEWAKREFKSEMKLMRVKGEEYCVSDEDKLKNFKSIAERLNTKPTEVVMVYLLKHMDSIRNYVLNGVESSDESISGRIRDARNYLMLLHAVILDEKTEQILKGLGSDKNNDDSKKKSLGFGEPSASSPLKFKYLEEVN